MKFNEYTVTYWQKKGVSRWRACNVKALNARDAKWLVEGYIHQIKGHHAFDKRVKRGFNNPDVEMNPNQIMNFNSSVMMDEPSRRSFLFHIALRPPQKKRWSDGKVGVVSIDDKAKAICEAYYKMWEEEK